MTKEELEKEAEEYARDTYEMCSYQGLPYASDRRARQQAFLAGAEPREKQIADLQAQIEKMKCCEICANSKDWRNRSLCIACEKSKSHINFVLRR